MRPTMYPLLSLVRSSSADAYGSLLATVARLCPQLQPSAFGYSRALGMVLCTSAHCCFTCSAASQTVVGQGVDVSSSGSVKVYLGNAALQALDDEAVASLIPGLTADLPSAPALGPTVQGPTAVPDLSQQGKAAAGQFMTQEYTKVCICMRLQLAI